MFSSSVCNFDFPGMRRGRHGRQPKQMRLTNCDASNTFKHCSFRQLSFFGLLAVEKVDGNCCDIEHQFTQLCVCMCVCMSVCLHVCMSACLHVCMSVCLYVCMSVCLYVCMHARMYVCPYVCMSVCLYVCLYVCMHACPYVYMSVKCM